MKFEKTYAGLTSSTTTITAYTTRRSRRKGKINLPFLVQVLTPVISLFFILGFAILPFFLHIEAKRLRIENISSISQLVKKDILDFFEENSGKDVKDLIHSVFSACEKSLWTKSCQVDFALPDIISVKFEEIIPVAFLLDGDKVFIVSQYGEKIQTPILISEMHQKGLNTFPIPFLIIKSGNCSLKEIADFLNYLYDVKKNFADQVVCLDFSVEIYSRQGYKIILPRDDMKYAFSRFLSVESKIQREGISEVDFRGNDKAFIK
jgi:cell division septal protein FtsQ